jgi:ferric-dicitrate binding protein FerR (iron transport regulator)
MTEAVASAKESDLLRWEASEELDATSRRKLLRRRLFLAFGAVLLIAAAAWGGWWLSSSPDGDFVKTTRAC